MTAFEALLTLDFRRSERASIDCLPCLSIESSGSEISQIGKSRSSNSLIMFLFGVFGSCWGYFMNIKKAGVPGCFMHMRGVILQHDRCSWVTKSTFVGCKCSWCQTALWLRWFAYSPLWVLLHRWKPSKFATQGPWSHRAIHTGLSLVVQLDLVILCSEPD